MNDAFADGAACGADAHATDGADALSGAGCAFDDDADAASPRPKMLQRPAHDENVRDDVHDGGVSD